MFSVSVIARQWCINMQALCCVCPHRLLRNVRVQFGASRQDTSIFCLFQMHHCQCDASFMCSRWATANVTEENTCLRKIKSVIEREKEDVNILHANDNQNVALTDQRENRETAVVACSAEANATPSGLHRTVSSRRNMFVYSMYRRCVRMGWKE